MKVVLLQTVPGIGRADEVKEVADGYARNFLFPKHLAVQASPQFSNELAARRRKKSKEAEQELREEQSAADKLDGIVLELKEKTNANGLLYAAVNPQKVAQALLALDLRIDKKQIVMNPIKEVGEYSILVKFRHGLEANFKVIVSAV